MQNKSGWYVLYTRPRAEKQVAARLAEAGEEVFLPLHLTPRKWSDRVKLVEMPLFASYVFVLTDRASLYDILRLPGVARVVYFQGEPAHVQVKEINALKEFLVYANGRVCHIEPDDDVRIAAGPLKDLEGKVLKVTKKQVTLRLQKLGLTAHVQLDQLVKK